MSACVYLCMCVHTYGMCIYTCICVYIMNVYVCIYVCVFVVRIYICIYVCLYMYVWVCVCVCVCMCSITSNTLQLHGLQPASLLCPSDSPGKRTGMGCHFFIQEISPTQGSNLRLLHWQADSLPLSHLGSPRMYVLMCK